MPFATSFLCLILTISTGRLRDNRDLELFSVLLNVGSSGSNPNGRGRIFEDFSFEYLPIPETEETIEKVPIYRELGFLDVKFPDLPVHFDPEFEAFSYGHVKRGFGDIECLLKLKRNDMLFFYATLQKGEKWYPYVIGYFMSLEVHDCRKLAREQILSFKSKGFANNAHLKRIDTHVDFLIKGGEGSKLLKKAFPLSENDNPLKLRKHLGNIILTATGKMIESGKPWFRWTLWCEKSNELVELVNSVL